MLLKPHVIYIVTKLELGGAQKVTLSLFKGLARHGLSASLISGAQGPLVGDVEGLDGVYLLKNFRREVSLRGIFSEIKLFFELVALIRRIKRKHKKVIVHTHSTKAGLIGRWAAFFAGASKKVHTVHGFGFNDEQPWLIWFAVYFLELVTSFITTHFVCVSQADRRLGVRLFPRFFKKSSIIRAAVDWNNFALAAGRVANMSGHEEFVFGAVVCFKPQKNILDLLLAFHHLVTKLPITERTPRLQIIGDGAQREHIERFIKEHNLSGSIDLLGWQRDVALWMRGWDAFVLSSLWEGLPCSIVEARLMRLPIVCYDVGGISDVVYDGINGFLIKPKDWLSLAHAMHRLMVDGPLCERLKNHHEDLLPFKDTVMISHHSSLYQQIL